MEGPLKGHATVRAHAAGHFTIGALAGVAQKNPLIRAVSMVPVRSVKLQVDKWDYGKLMLGLIASLHLLISIFSVLIASRV